MWLATESNLAAFDIHVQVSDVKRVWSLRQSLLLMDFEDNSSESLKQLLHQCMIHPMYLKLEEVNRKCKLKLEGNIKVSFDNSAKENHQGS